MDQVGGQKLGEDIPPVIRRPMTTEEKEMFRYVLAMSYKIRLEHDQTQLIYKYRDDYVVYLLKVTDPETKKTTYKEKFKLRSYQTKEEMQRTLVALRGGVEAMNTPLQLAGMPQLMTPIQPLGGKMPISKSERKKKTTETSTVIIEEINDPIPSPVAEPKLSAASRKPERPDLSAPRQHISSSAAKAPKRKLTAVEKRALMESGSVDK